MDLRSPRTGSGSTLPLKRFSQSTSEDGPSHRNRPARYLRATLFVAILSGAAQPASAVPSATPVAQQQDSAQVIAGAPVVVRGDTLFQLYGTLGPFSAGERARALAARLRRLQADPLVRAEKVTVVDTTGVSDIRVDTVVLMTVTDRDAAAAGLTRAALAERYAAGIRDAIRSRGSRATLQSILLGALLTLLTTAVLVIVFKLFGKFFPTLYRLLRSWRDTKIPSIRIQRLEVLSSQRLTDALIAAARVVRIVAVLLVLYIYFPLVFSFFPWTRGLAGTLVGYVTDPLTLAWRSFVTYLPDLFTVGVIVVVFRYLLKFIRMLFVGLERGAVTLPNFHRDWALPTYKIVRFMVIVFAAIVIYPYLPGSDTAAFKGISVFLGVLISFGSSSAISNVVAGVVITYMRPFQIGDRVRIADTEGDVIERTLLITRVRTIKNVEITVPNAMVLASHIVNYSGTVRNRGVILHTSVSIGYDAPWRQVHELLIAAATATENILEKPEPFVLQRSLDDFFVTYELNAWTDQPHQMARTYSDLHQNIQDRFAEADVEIMSPHYRAVRRGNDKAIPKAQRVGRQAEDTA